MTIPATRVGASLTPTCSAGTDHLMRGYDRFHSQQVYRVNRWGDREAVGRIYRDGGWSAHAYGYSTCPRFRNRADARRYVLAMAQQFEERHGI